MKCIALWLLAACFSLTAVAQEESYRFLAGTYTNTGKSRGIYSGRVDVSRWTSSLVPAATNVVNPSFLAFSPDKKFVYAVNENGTKSSVSAFVLNSSSGKLRLLNRVQTQGADPCHISVTRRHVFTANYTGGSISVFGRKDDGSLTGLLQKIQHTGKSINPERQNEPHVHQVLLSPDEKFLLAADLGTDKITVYKYNPKSEGGILEPYDSLLLKPGSGSRHVAFGKDGRKLYVVQEIDGTVSVCNYNSGHLSLEQETTLAIDKKAVNGAADIHVSPDGRFVYATNRGTANTISCFVVNADGTLELFQQLPSGGSGPRNFAITPDGKYVFVAHQHSSNVVVFKREANGALTRQPNELKAPVPVCLKFF